MTTPVIRERTPAEKAARRREEKRLVGEVADAARWLAKARGEGTHVPRVTLMQAINALHRHWGIR